MGVPMKLIQIISAGIGECCDLNPPFSLHKDQSKIMPFCKTRELDFTFEKKCSCGCDILYSWDTPFVKSDQIGDPEYMAIRCWEKKYNVNRDNYRVALIAEYKLELKMKGEL